MFVKHMQAPPWTYGIIFNFYPDCHIKTDTGQFTQWWLEYETRWRCFDSVCWQLLLSCADTHHVGNTWRRRWVWQQLQSTYSQWGPVLKSVSLPSSFSSGVHRSQNEWQSQQYLKYKTRTITTIMDSVTANIPTEPLMHNALYRHSLSMHLLEQSLQIHPPPTHTHTHTHTCVGSCETSVESS